MRCVVAFLVVLMASPALGQGVLLGEYTARIGPQDRVNSNGDRLDTVAAILRQDRANYHRFDQADAEDEGDPVFTTPYERGRFERLIARGVLTRDARRAILAGTPLVHVRIYPTRVHVDLADPDASAGPS